MRKEIKLAVIGGLGVALVSCISCAPIRKAYWDHEIRELCRKDAGVTVYERVGMSKEEYKKFRLLALDDRNENQMYYSKFKTSYIKDNDNISIMKFEEHAIRKSDGKVLGTSVSYARKGGDSIFHWPHPTQFGCWSIGIDPNLRTSVFYMEQ
ncbi:MAG: hypothetical protein U1F12_02850 [Pseudomonadales bacterium]|jgi:hypothetical protein|nr:hypothetical protein [Pseudomonadales bacterium]